MSGSTGNEPLLVFRWLYETLTNDAILAPLIGTRVYEYSAPLGATYPFITMAHMGGSDKRALGGYRIWNEGLYLITGHIQGQSLQDLKTIADRIDTLIDNTQATTLSYATIVYCLRQRPFEMTEHQNATFYKRSGGQYRIACQSPL